MATKKKKTTVRKAGGMKLLKLLRRGGRVPLSAAFPGSIKRQAINLNGTVQKTKKTNEKKKKK